MAQRYVKNSNFPNFYCVKYTLVSKPFCRLFILLYLKFEKYYMVNSKMYLLYLAILSLFCVFLFCFKP